MRTPMVAATWVSVSDLRWSVAFRLAEAPASPDVSASFVVDGVANKAASITRRDCLPLTPVGVGPHPAR